ncbi:MAG: hypothetical protein GXY64_11590 [Bacteroidales bacterium]|nr:hypothetical protein [Bacteroidales bacterium]
MKKSNFALISCSLIAVQPATACEEGILIKRISVDFENQSEDTIYVLDSGYPLPPAEIIGLYQYGRGKFIPPHEHFPRPYCRWSI